MKAGLAPAPGAAELARARRDAYAFLARELSERPAGEGWTARGHAAALRRAVGGLAPGRINEMVRWLLGTPDAAERLQASYTGLFEIRSRRHLLPFESVYVGASWDGTRWRLGRLRGPAWHAVLATYRRHGFEPAPGVEADNLACELSLLAALCEREAEAWDADDLETACAALRDTSDFIAAHPARWVTRLRQRAEDLADVRWYLDIVHLTERLIRIEQRHLARDGPVAA